MPRRNPRLRNRPTPRFKIADNPIGMAARRGFEPRPPGSEPGVVPVPPPRIDRWAFVWTGGFEPPLPAPEAGVLHVEHHVQVGTDGGIRTHTHRLLRAVPLPVGLRRLGGPSGSRTRNRLLAGELRFHLRYRPKLLSSWRARESNPPGWAYEALLIPDRPLGWGDRRDSNPLGPGPHPGASNTLASVTVDEGGVEPPASPL
jgi:hypothetical protein